MDTLTRMRAFIDVVEAEGFSAAGRKVGRSKALLSKYVRELEDELGALAAQPHHAAVFADRGRPHLLQAGIRDHPRDRFSGRQRCAIPPATCAAASSCRRRAPSPTRRSASR
jgi:hypothetical protein